MTDIVAIRDLDHRYGKTHALRGVDLTVASSECVALLGPNGAGKTTLVGALTGALAPAGGTVRINGKLSTLMMGIVSSSIASLP